MKGEKNGYLNVTFFPPSVFTGKHIFFLSNFNVSKKTPQRSHPIQALQNYVMTYSCAASLTELVASTEHNEMIQRELYLRSQWEDGSANANTADGKMTVSELMKTGKWSHKEGTHVLQ